MSVAPDVIELLGGPGARIAPEAGPARCLVVDARGDRERLARYRALRREEFVHRQGLFARDDADAWDAHPETIVLTALSPSGEVLGGVRLHPTDSQLGWWRGSRLVVAPSAGRGAVGAALVRAACGRALDAGALRFDAFAQPAHATFFISLGWESVRPLTVAGRPHLLMRWPIERLGEHARATKAPLGELVGPLLGHDRWLGDDGVPVPGTDAVACTDAITPSMVERDPEWAGWCGMLVTANDLAAMGAEPLGALDAVGGPDRDHVARVLAGLRAGADAFGLPILGGHTQLSVPASLTVTGFGRAADPVRGGGGRPGDALWLCADLGGGWRPGYRGRQWDSSSSRSHEEIGQMLGIVRTCRPAAAKDASMAGIAGTVGMLAEASGCGAELDLARLPRPVGAPMAEWLSCFPGFAMILAQRPAAPSPGGGACGPAVRAGVGALTSEAGVRLRWPDGELTTAIPAAGVTGLGAAAR
jgi:putative N-acetyltransferase (TIGR04045 family)